MINITDSVGDFYISKINGNDVMGAIKDKTRHFRACLMFQTFTTQTSQFWFLKIMLYALVLIIAFFIVTFRWLRSYLARITIQPEWIYVAIALPFSIAFSFITPPTQVPDEGSHFARAFELSEFQFFNTNKTIPASLEKLDSSFAFYHENADDKITVEQIMSHSGVKLEPGKRVPANAPDYTLPYLPQALGIFIGKIFASSPLALMYYGRLFNLLVSITLIFFAIRIIPSFKWIFLLVALMPKTVFLFGSLSYDTLTISLSFITIAVFLYYAYACQRNLNLKDLALMTVLCLLLLFCKPPYFLIGLLFFFIPPKKFGVLYKYIMISIGVVAVAAVFLIVRQLPVNDPSANNGSQQQITTTSGTTQQLAPFRPGEQMKHIRSDIPAYIGIMLKNGFVTNRNYTVESFFGYLGWIDVELPKVWTYGYLVLMVLASLVLSTANINLGFFRKTLLFLILAAAFVIIHTAMYLYATHPGNLRIWGVQGRYFIPLAPLLLMLFYNRYFNPKLNLLFSLRRKEYMNAKPKVKPGILTEIEGKEQLFDKSMYLVIICFCTFTLAYALYLTMVRYYNIL